MGNKNQIQESKRKYICIFLILIALLILMIFLGYKQNKKIDLDNLSINESKLNKLKYHIDIDCEWVAKNKLNDLVVYDSKASELCRGIFPDLNWSSQFK